MVDTLVRSERSQRLASSLIVTVCGRDHAERWALNDIAFVNCFVASAAHE